MSDFTFNIADYRPLARVRNHDCGFAAKARSGFVVLTPNSDSRGFQSEWHEAAPAVVDIRSVRDGHRTPSRGGKILRFSNAASHRVYMMPVHHDSPSRDDDPGPMVA